MFRAKGYQIFIHLKLICLMKPSALFPRFFQAAACFVLAGFLASCSKESVEPMAAGNDGSNGRRVVLIEKEGHRQVKPLVNRDPSVRQVQPDVLATKVKPACTSCGNGDRAQAADPILSAETFHNDYTEMAAPSGQAYPSGPEVQDPTIQVIRNRVASARKPIRNIR